MSDPMEDMLLESAAQEAAESEQRQIVLQRITELRDMIAGLVEAVALLMEMERAESNGEKTKDFTVTERDEYGQIKSFRMH